MLSMSMVVKMEVKNAVAVAVADVALMEKISTK